MKKQKIACSIISITLNVYISSINNVKIDDKRLDKWVNQRDIMPSSQQQSVKLTPIDVERSKIITRGTKRKMEVLYPQSQELTDLPPEVMDQEKKYQEKTKVILLKNIIKNRSEISKKLLLGYMK